MVLTELLQLWTPSLAAKTTPAMNVKSVASMSAAIRIIFDVSVQAAANPTSKTSHEKTATNIA